MEKVGGDHDGKFWPVFFGDGGFVTAGLEPGREVPDTDKMMIGSPFGFDEEIKNTF